MPATRVFVYRLFAWISHTAHGCHTVHLSPLLRCRLPRLPRTTGAVAVHVTGRCHRASVVYVCVTFYVTHVCCVAVTCRTRTTVLPRSLRSFVAFTPRSPRLRLPRSHTSGCVHRLPRVHCTCGCTSFGFAFLCRCRLCVTVARIVYVRLLRLDLDRSAVCVYFAVYRTWFAHRLPRYRHAHLPAISSAGRYWLPCSLRILRTCRVVWLRFRVYSAYVDYYTAGSVVGLLPIHIFTDSHRITGFAAHTAAGLRFAYAFYTVRTPAFCRSAVGATLDLPRRACRGSVWLRLPPVTVLPYRRILPRLVCRRSACLHCADRSRYARTVLFARYARSAHRWLQFAAPALITRCGCVCGYRFLDSATVLLPLPVYPPAGSATPRSHYLRSFYCCRTACARCVLPATAAPAFVCVAVLRAIAAAWLHIRVTADCGYCGYLRCVCFTRITVTFPVGSLPFCRLWITAPVRLPLVTADSLRLPVDVLPRCAHAARVHAPRVTCRAFYGYGYCHLPGFTRLRCYRLPDAVAVTYRSAVALITRCRSRLPLDCRIYRAFAFCTPHHARTFAFAIVCHVPFGLRIVCCRAPLVAFGCCARTRVVAGLDCRLCRSAVAWILV